MKLSSNLRLCHRFGKLEWMKGHLVTAVHLIDDQERSVGVRCIAAPIRNQNGSIVVGTPVLWTHQLIPANRIEPLSRVVMNRVAQISDDQGYRYNKGQSNAKQS